MLPDGTVRTRQPRRRAASSSTSSSAATACSASSSTPSSTIADNAVYQSERRVIDYRAFADVSRREIAADAACGLMYGHLSTAPGSRCCARCCSTPTAPSTRPTPPCRRSARSARSSCAAWSSTCPSAGRLWMRLKWFAEKHVEPRLESCTVTRNEAMGQGEACLVSRNDPMHDSVPYLRNNLPRRDRHPARVLHPAGAVRRRSSTGCARSSQRERGQSAERLGPRRAPRGQRPELRARGRHARGRALPQPADDRARQRSAMAQLTEPAHRPHLRPGRALLPAVSTALHAGAAARGLSRRSTRSSPPSAATTPTSC